MPSPYGRTVRTQQALPGKPCVQRGFTLVELLIVVAIVGVLSALAAYGVNKHVARAKTAEAINAVGRMAKDAATAYVPDSMSGAIKPGGSSAPVSHNLCAGVADGEAVPAVVAAIRGSKYQSRSEEWNQGSATQGWRCLRFSIEHPQYYQYDYRSEGGGASGTTFEAIARGDLDADGTLSKFAMHGQLTTGTASVRDVLIAPTVTMTDAEE